MSETESKRRHEKRKKHPFSWWMSWFFIAGSILVLLYTYNRAEMVPQGEQRGTYFKYYVISLTGVLFWGVVLRLRADIRANLVTAAISTLVSLYLLEGGLTFFGVKQPMLVNQLLAYRAAAAAELGIKYDERTKLELHEDLIAEGVDAAPAFWPSGSEAMDFFDHHLFPLGGVANKTTVADNESGKYLIYRSDRHGFNNPDTQWDSRTIEWLLIGDSFAHGATLQRGQEIAGQIRSITGTDVINLGISGNGPLVEYATLVEYGKVLAPEKVLWVYYEGNDLSEDLQREKKNPLFMQYMKDGFSQNLINRQKEIDARLEEFNAKAAKAAIVAKAAKEAKYKWRHKRRWIRLHAIRNLIAFDQGVDVAVDDPLFTKILTKAKARVEAWGGELYFVYLPQYNRYNKKAISHDRHTKKSEVVNVVKRLDIPVIDIHQEVFADHSDPLSLFPFRGPGHYNKEGASEVAKAIIANIKK